MSDGSWTHGWDGHERAQRQRLARLPLAEKIRWLEQAQATVQTLERARQERRAVERTAEDPRSGT